MDGSKGEVMIAGHCGRRRLLLLIVAVLMAGMIVACDLEGLFGGGDAVPNVVIDAPPNNTEVRQGEVIPIRCTATDDAGVIRVELWVGDAPFGSEISPVAQGQSPFSAVVEWRPQALGSHRVMVRAYDAAGNVGDSAAITLVVVAGPPGPGPTPTGPQPTTPVPQPTQPAPPPTQPPPQPTQPGPPPTQPPPPTNTPTPTATPPTGPCLPSVVDTIGLVGHPKGVAAHDHRVYVALHDQPLVQVIDADNNTVLPSVNTHASAGPKYGNAVIFHNGRVYVTNRDAASVSWVDVSNPTDWKEISVGSLPFGLAAAGQYVYVANFGDDRVGRIDSSTDAYSSLIATFDKPALLAGLGLDVFVPTNGPGPIYRVAPIGSPIAIGASKPGYFAAAVNPISGRVFVTDRDGGNVLKINANTNSVEGGPLHMPHRPYGIAVNSSKGRVYVVAAEANRLYVVRGATLEIVGDVPVGAQGPADGGQGIALWGDRIFVSNYQGGSLTVLDDSVCP